MDCVKFAVSTYMDCVKFANLHIFLLYGQNADFYNVKPLIPYVDRKCGSDKMSVICIFYALKAIL